MRILLFISILGALINIVPAQAQSSKSFEDVDDFVVDQLGYVYLVSKSGQLKKITAEGDSVAVYNQVRKHGQLHRIDVSNPLKVLLHYKNFNTVVILDRLLNVTSTLDLRKMGRYQISSIATSYDNNIWIYDEMNAELLKIDEAGNTLTSSYSLVDILTELPNPQQIFDQQRIVYLYDPLKGLYQFDYFGAFKGKLALLNLKDLFVWNDILYGRDDQSLIKYDLKTHRETIIPYDPLLGACKKIYIMPNLIFKLLNDTLFIERNQSL